MVGHCLLFMAMHFNVHSSILKSQEINGYSYLGQVPRLQTLHWFLSTCTCFILSLILSLYFSLSLYCEISLSVIFALSTLTTPPIHSPLLPRMTEMSTQIIYELPSPYKFFFKFLFIFCETISSCPLQKFASVYATLLLTDSPLNASPLLPLSFSCSVET